MDLAAHERRQQSLAPRAQFAGVPGLAGLAPTFEPGVGGQPQDERTDRAAAGRQLDQKQFEIADIHGRTKD